MLRNLIKKKLAQVKKRLAQAIQGFFAWALAHPRSLVWPLFRTFMPILRLKQVTLISRFDDVYEVLTMDEVFHVPYGPDMEDMTEGSNFFLGMNDQPTYTRDVSNMRIVVPREDIPIRIEPFVNQTASDLVRNSGGRLDAVAELANVVPPRLIGDYFGTPGPSESELMGWARAIFEFLFIDPQDDTQIRINALKAACGLRDYLDKLIAQRGNGKSSHDDVLARCLELRDAGIEGMTDLGIRNNLFGLIVGALPTTAKATTYALDTLLDRPQVLARAGEAARADDDQRLQRYVFEALRFKPINPGLSRVVARDHRIAAGHFRSRRLRKGSKVLAVSQSAMFDRRRVRSPRQFRIDRPPEIYFHFGKGMHTCFGDYISMVQIPGILKPLLRCHDLRRATSPLGKLQMKGPFPSHLVVEFTTEA